MYCQVHTNVTLDISAIPLPEDEVFFTESQKYGAAMKNVTPNPMKLTTFHVEDKQQLLKVLPADLLTIEIPDVILLSMDAQPVKSPSVTAHIDYNRRCALNYYLLVNGETTHYYEWCKKENSLTEVDMFCAKNNEWWLMDTSKPHAVMLIPNKQRLLLSYSFKKTAFTRVKQILKG